MPPAEPSHPHGRQGPALRASWTSRAGGRPREFRRFVAIGDSLTEGMGDPLPGGGFAGWADRLAGRLAASAPQLAYANLAVRGNGAELIRRVQLPAALALEPDLIAAVVGMNDLIHPRLDLRGWRQEVDTIFKGSAATGATVLSATLPDMSRVIPLARLLRAKTAAMREIVLDRGDAHGVGIIDLWSDPRAVDPALWSLDRLHPNPYGHLLLAADAAALLGLPFEVERPADYVPATRRGAAWAQAVWLATQFTPWVVRRVRGRSSGDGRTGKRLSLSSVAEPASSRTHRGPEQELRIRATNLWTDRGADRRSATRRQGPEDG